MSHVIEGSQVANPDFRCYRETKQQQRRQLNLLFTDLRYFTPLSNLKKSHWSRLF